MPKLKIAVTGAAGRMGRELIRGSTPTRAACSRAPSSRRASLALGQDAGLWRGLASSVSSSSMIPSSFHQGRCGARLHRPGHSLEFAALAANARIVHVFGTTAWRPEEAKISAAARHATIITAGNMSLGINLLSALVRKVAEALDADFDIEVLEMHHRHKVDVPSGTALMLGQAAADGRQVRLEDVSVRARDGHTGERRRGDIGFASLRGGSVVGDHSVIFAADGERIELVHRAADRGIYARGAVKAALWARGKGPGLFNMMDVLGIESAKPRT